MGNVNLLKRGTIAESDSQCNILYCHASKSTPTSDIFMKHQPERQALTSLAAQAQPRQSLVRLLGRPCQGVVILLKAKANRVVRPYQSVERHTITVRERKASKKFHVAFHKPCHNELLWNSITRTIKADWRAANSRQHCT